MDNKINKQNFITFKNHEKDFIREAVRWLLNPTKHNISKINKIALDIVYNNIERHSISEQNEER